MKKIVMLLSVLVLTTSAHAIIGSPSLTSYGYLLRDSNNQGNKSVEAAAGVQAAVDAVNAAVDRIVVGEIVNVDAKKQEAKKQADEATRKLRALKKYNENFAQTLERVAQNHEDLVKLLQQEKNQYTYQALFENMAQLAQNVQKLNDKTLIDIVREILNHDYYFAYYKLDSLISLSELAEHVNDEASTEGNGMLRGEQTFYQDLHK